MKITTSNLVRWAGLSAVAAGSLFIIIQAIHPLDVLSSVVTPQWAIVHIISTFMCLFGMLGITGVYVKQAEKAGWLGLIGFLLLFTFYAITLAFQFVEAFFSPLLATQAPSFLEGFMGMVSGKASAVELGAIPTVYALTGMLGYMTGGVLFGIATFRADVLPRWAGVLLAVGVVLPLVASGLIPHPLDRIFAVPVGLAVAWLGYATWAESGEKVVNAVPISAVPSMK